MVVSDHDPAWARLTGLTGLPGRVAADEVRHVGEAVGAQQAGCDRRPVSAGAVHHGRRRRVELFEAREQRGQADGAGSTDGAERDLAWIADVDDHEPGHRANPLGERLGGQPRQRLDQLRMGDERADGVSECAEDPIEADAGEAHLRLGFVAGWRHEHDRCLCCHDLAGVLGKSATEADVHRAP